MNILLDFITLSRRTGAGEYLRCVYKQLTEAATDNITLYALYDSAKGIAYNDLVPDELVKKGIQPIDIYQQRLTDIINRMAIDKFFIGCAQYVGNYPCLEDINCPVICVIHDLAYEEQYREDLDVYYRLKAKSTISFVNWLIFHRKKDISRNDLISPYVKLAKHNMQVTFVTVSDFTRHSLLYSMDIPEDRVKVLYSPERIYVQSTDVISNEVRSLLDKKIFLLLGAQHASKNALRAIHAFEMFAKTHPDNYLLTVGYKNMPRFKQHLVLPFLNDGGLMAVYQSCHALLYPSLFEGFGYPPLEAMHYGKPVMASNIGPIREIFGDAPIYFNPFSETDIFYTLCTTKEEDYALAAKRSSEQFKHISIRLRQDLCMLLKLILEAPNRPCT